MYETSLVSDVVRCGYSVATGCAKGLDSIVREICPEAVVFSVSSVGFRGRGAFAARSSQLIKSSCKLVAFVSAPCPSRCVPSRSFRGFGSGTWGSVSLAVGLGIPVVVFCPGSFLLPVWSGGSWVQIGGSSVWGSGFKWVSF